jgi:hypothetical protein
MVDQARAEFGLELSVERLEAESFFQLAMMLSCLSQESSCDCVRDGLTLGLRSDLRHGSVTEFRCC